jgi:hypothetical protein
MWLRRSVRSIELQLLQQKWLAPQCRDSVRGPSQDRLQNTLLKRRQPGTPHDGIATRPAVRHLEQLLGRLVVCAALLGACPVRGDEAGGVPTHMELRNNSAANPRRLILDLGEEPAATLKACDVADAFGDCVGDWRVVRRPLLGAEVAEFQRTALDANLFGGSIAGGLLDHSFASLEVRQGANVVVLVTSFNESFEKVGARKKLLEMLHALRSEMTAKLAP